MERPPTTDDIIARLGELYRTDPEAFEAMRKLLIEETIEGFPPEHRARAYGLQFRLDAELSRCRDPISRMNRMIEIFWEGVRTFQDVITDPGAAVRKREQEKAPGKILPFPDKSVH